jgi:PAS domain S-box-containing protein
VSRVPAAGRAHAAGRLFGRFTASVTDNIVGGTDPDLLGGDVGGANATVLVVDDDPEALALLVQVLGQAGYRVQPADSGELALASFAVQPPELILLDVRIPDMDGFEVCRRIRATEQGRRIPLMFISASTAREEWAHGLELGAVDFISKPFLREELLARVQSHVELGRLRAQLELRVAQRTADLRDAVEQLRLEVAERRRAEQASKESEARFRDLANAAPAAIWTSGPDGRVDFCNQFALDFSGRTPEQLAGDGWFALIHPDDSERVRRVSSEAAQARSKFQVEARMRRGDGEYRDVLEVGTPRFRPGGEFAGYVGVVIDITEFKHNQQRALAAKNLENLRLLSAGIAHNFNSLVGAILGEAYLASADMDPDSPGYANIQRITAVANRAADVVRLLMAYVGDPSDDAPQELVDLNNIVREIVPHLKPSSTRAAEIRMSAAPRLPSVQVRAHQIRQVVLNLILNAVEALQGQKGMVTVATSEVEIGPDPMDGNWPELARGRYVKLEVADTGCGMTDEVKARIFDPYYTTKFLGRGLGLAAAQGIVRSYGGHIIARSAYGEGSTFEVLLPCASSALPPSPVER